MRGPLNNFELLLFRLHRSNFLECRSVRAAGWMAIACAAAVAMPATVQAHHSFAAEYDANKPVTLKGKVTRMDWTNPHCLIYIDVTAADGKVVNWLIEAGAPNALIRRGWKRN